MCVYIFCTAWFETFTQVSGEAIFESRSQKDCKFCPFLVMFAKLRKAVVSFVMSFRPSVCLRLPLDGFSWNLIFEYIPESLSIFVSHSNLVRITGTLHEDLFLSSCDRASWAKCEEREKTNKMQQLDVYYQLLSQHVSGTIMPIFRRTKAVLLHLVYWSGSVGCGW